MAIRPIRDRSNFDRHSILVERRPARQQQPFTDGHPQQLRHTRVRIEYLDDEIGDRRLNAVLLERLMKRCRPKVDIRQKRGSSQRKLRSIDGDRHVVEKAKPLEVEQLATGGDTKDLRFLDRRLPYLGAHHHRRRRQPTAERELRKSDELVGDVSQRPRGRPPSATGPTRHKTIAGEQRKRSAQRQTADSQRLAQRALRREPRPRTPFVCQTLCEHVVRALVQRLKRRPARRFARYPGARCAMRCDARQDRPDLGTSQTCQHLMTSCRTHFVWPRREGANRHHPEWATSC